jgi:hypothetical protein
MDEIGMRKNNTNYVECGRESPKDEVLRKVRRYTEGVFIF